MTNRSQADEVSEYLLAQHDAICEFERTLKLIAPLYRVGSIKHWFFLKENHILRDRPDVVKLCEELTEIVPIDHYYWSDPRGFRYE